MPLLSNVIRTSMVAVGAVVDLDFIGFDRLGANAEERRFEIFCLSQVAVMLSGKSLEGGSKNRGQPYILYIRSPTPNLKKMGGMGRKSLVV